MLFPPQVTHFPDLAVAWRRPHWGAGGSGGLVCEPPEKDRHSLGGRVSGTDPGVGEAGAAAFPRLCQHLNHVLYKENVYLRHHLELLPKQKLAF